MWLLQFYLFCAALTVALFVLMVWKAEGWKMVRAEAVQILLWSCVWPYVLWFVIWQWRKPN